MYATSCGEIQYLSQGLFTPHSFSWFSVPMYSVLRTLSGQISLIVVFLVFWWQFFFGNEDVIELLQFRAQVHTQLLLQLIAKGHVEGEEEEKCQQLTP